MFDDSEVSDVSSRRPQVAVNLYVNTGNDVRQPRLYFSHRHSVSLLVTWIFYRKSALLIHEEACWGRQMYFIFSCTNIGGAQPLGNFDLPRESINMCFYKLLLWSHDYARSNARLRKTIDVSRDWLTLLMHASRCQTLLVPLSQSYNTFFQCIPLDVEEEDVHRTTRKQSLSMPNVIANQWTQRRKTEGAQKEEDCSMLSFVTSGGSSLLLRYCHYIALLARTHSK